VHGELVFEAAAVLDGQAQDPEVAAGDAQEGVAGAALDEADELDPVGLAAEDEGGGARFDDGQVVEGEEGVDGVRRRAAAAEEVSFRRGPPSGCDRSAAA
jgi:hypothetical protein